MRSYLYVGIVGSRVKARARWADVPLSFWGRGLGCNWRNSIATWYVLGRPYSRSHDERGFSVAVRAPHLIKEPSDMVSF